MNNKQNKEVSLFIEKGSEISGAAAGGAISFLAGGPVAAAFGAVAGPVVAMALHTIGDYAHRILSKRETVRVAAVSALSIDRIRRLIEKGKLPRDDDFFKHRSGSLPKAEELYEGVLLKAKSENEERKILLLSNFYASICFRQDISSDSGNWIIQLIEKLTYGHFNTLYAFYELGNNNNNIEWNSVRSNTKNDLFLLAKIEDLKNNQMITQGFWGDSPAKITKLGNEIIELTDFATHVDKNDEELRVVRDKIKNWI